MDQESIRILDDVDELDVIEVHYLTIVGDDRTAVGEFNGFKRYGRDWWLRLVQKPSVRTIDIQQVRILTPAGHR